MKTKAYFSILVVFAFFASIVSIVYIGASSRFERNLNFADAVFPRDKISRNLNNVEYFSSSSFESKVKGANSQQVRIFVKKDLDLSFLNQNMYEILKKELSNKATSSENKFAIIGFEDNAQNKIVYLKSMQTSADFKIKIDSKTNQSALED